MSVRFPIAISVLAATFAAGLVASRLWERDARAQTSPFAATISLYPEQFVELMDEISPIAAAVHRSLPRGIKSAEPIPFARG